MAGRDPVDELISLAAQLRAAGRTAEAVVAYERLLAIEPALPNSWYNLGLLRRRERRFEAALEAYQKALAYGVDQPEEVHLNRGVIYADDLGRPEQAEQALRHALAANPRYVPALLNLGNLHEDRGERDAARACYERALEVDASSADALARLAGLCKAADPGDPLILRLKAALATPANDAADRANLGFALGRLLDGCGAYDAAFEAYAQANRDSRASLPAHLAGYDGLQHESFIDRLIAGFSGLGPVNAGDHQAPIFICGMFRSGSTLVEQALAGHRLVTAGGELDLLPALVRDRLRPFPEAIRPLGAAALDELARRYRQDIESRFPGAVQVTDKRPENYLYIGLIKSLFPRAKIVHTVRHPLDNCLSIYFLNLAHNRSYALDLMATGHQYLQYRRLMRHWKACWGDDIFDFDYDRFVREPRAALQSLLDFLGLEWDEACLAFEQRRNLVKTASVWQVREPLYDRSSGRWRHYQRQLEPLARLLERSQALQAS